jgi:hypothetical protein
LCEPSERGFVHGAGRSWTCAFQKISRGNSATGKMRP